MHFYGPTLLAFDPEIGLCQIIRTWPVATCLTLMVTQIATPLVVMLPGLVLPFWCYLGFDVLSQNYVLSISFL